MLKEDIRSTIKAQREFFTSGATYTYAYRIEKLKRLKTVIQLNERKIMDALKADLGKHDFEGYATEISVVYTEINHTIKHLRRWMRVKRVGTPIASFGGVSKIYKQPLGVALIMSPWNYPFMLAIAPLVAVIAAGNCVVLKPSSYSPNTSTVIEEMIEANFEKNYIAVFQGNRDINTVIINENFDHIFFTGSVKVGKIVMEAASKNLTPIVLELGGKSPCIVDKSVDIAKAARRIVWGKSVNSGQTCVAPDYLLVHKDVKDKLIKEMIKASKKFYGDNTIETDDFGSIIRPAAFDGLIKLLEGQTVLHGGRYDEAKQKIELTFLDNPSLDSDIMQREIFGPILPIITVDDMDGAIDIIRKHEKPLALYIFTKDSAVQKRFVKNIQFGGGCINDTIMHLANGSLPFGGIGNSGMGSYHGIEGFNTFSHKKSILKQNYLFDLPIRYAPYKSKLSLIKKLIK